MKIKDERPSNFRRAIDKFAVGMCFVHDGNPYLVARHPYSEETKFVNLCTGVIEPLTTSASVEVVDAEVVIKIAPILF